MSNQPPAAPTNPTLLPPEERFWRRYSPHQEAPLSGVGSLTLHALAAGALVLAALLIQMWDSGPRASIPIEPMPGPVEGDRGGKPGGLGDAPAVPLKDDPGSEKADPNADPASTPHRQALPAPEPAAKPAFSPPPDDGEGRRFNGRIIGAQLDGLGGEAAKAAGSRQAPPSGGDKQGPGKRDGGLTKRQERMLRWSMTFDTRSGQDYLRQLARLGAFLAVPKDKDEKEGQYQVIRDLSKKPAKPLDEDVSKIDRISWIDNSPKSVAGLMEALGLDRKPSHFVAFMPKKLEEKLFELERDYKGLKEDEIEQTFFKVILTDDGYEIKVTSQTRK